MNFSQKSKQQAVFGFGVDNAWKWNHGAQQTVGFDN